MDMLDGVFKLFDQYPAWAKYALLVLGSLIAAVLLLARTPEMKQPLPVSAGTQVYLHILRVALHPDDPAAGIKVLANVNETEYIHPSVAGVEWMRVGPDMSRKIIPLPAADAYHVRFKMRYQTGGVAQNDVAKVFASKDKAASAPLGALTIPYDAEQKLYLVKDGTTSSGVAAEVFYRLSYSGL